MTEPAILPIWEDARLSPTDILVAMVLQELADPDGWCWSPTAEIGRRTRLCDKAVRTALKTLAETGWLTTMPHPKDRRSQARQVQKYRYDVPLSEKIPVRGTANYRHVVPVNDHLPVPGTGNFSEPSLYKKINTTNKHNTDDLQNAIEPPAKKTNKRATPKHVIPEGWQPDQKTVDVLIATHGIPEAFILQEVPSFVIYWRERRTKRPGWNATFINRVKQAWQWESKHGSHKPHAGKSEYQQTWADLTTEALEPWPAAPGNERH